jgi:hypothetical protein
LFLRKWNFRDGLAVAVAVLRHQLGDVRIGDCVVLFLLIYIDVVEAKEVKQVGAIDNAQAEELPNTWLRVAVFQLGQPAV